MGEPASSGSPARPRRRYDSRLRRERAAQTREAIVAAGLELAHECPVWDWRGLTIRAAAERAGVSERTVYRHFPSEREFHDAVMRGLEGQAGVTLEGMRLADVADATARVFAHVASFPMVVRTPLDPTLSAADKRRVSRTKAAAGMPLFSTTVASRSLSNFSHFCANPRPCGVSERLRRFPDGAGLTSSSPALSSSPVMRLTEGSDTSRASARARWVEAPSRSTMNSTRKRR